jgi:hypothetical protein
MAEAKTFYSSSGNLICYLEKPRRVIENGQSVVLDGPRIEFSPQGDNFGRYVTSDPQEIAYLEKRSREVKDVFGGDTYIKLTTPAEVRNAQLERQISTQNALILDLEKRAAAAEAKSQARK